MKKAFKINFDTNDHYEGGDEIYCENLVGVYKKLQELIGLDFMKYLKYCEDAGTFVSRMMNDKEKSILRNYIYKNTIPLNIDCDKLFNFDIKILVSEIDII